VPVTEPTTATTPAALPAQGRGRRGGRRVLAGLADQALVAITSAGTGLLATALLSPAAAGVMLYSVAILFFVQGIGRAFVGDVMLTHVPRFDDAGQRRRQFENAHATALALAVVAMAVLVTVWLVAPARYVGDLIWGVPIVPAVLLQDLCRYTYQTRGLQARALVIDVCWVSVQIAGILVLAVTGHATGGTLIASWGAGAAAGALLFYARTRINPLRGRPLRWLRDTRHLLGWFTATGVLGQVTTLGVGTLVQGILNASAYASLRLVQTLVLQPAQSFVMALNGLLVPRASRFAGTGDIAGLRRQTRDLLAVNCAIGVVLVVVAATLASPALHWYRHGAYAGAIPIAVPIAAQAWAYLMQIPFTVGIRGMQRGPYLFTQYLIFSVTSLGGLVLGAVRGGLTGAAWGLLAGAVVGLLVQAYLYLRAVRQLSSRGRSGSPT